MIDAPTPELVRNPNLLGRAIGCSVASALWAAVVVASNFALGWWMLVLLAGGILWVAYNLAGWWVTTLTVDDDGVAIADLDGSTEVPWAEIDRFEIRPPERRTQVMLTFGWWRDRATLRLRDGSVVPVPAIQPWHGAGHFGIGHETKADRLVDRLNRVSLEQSARMSGCVSSPGLS